MKIIYTLLALFLLTSMQASEIIPASTNVGENYMSLLSHIGKDRSLSYENDVVSLFAPDCKKIVNGSLWYEGAHHFLPQLLEIGEKVGSWTIEPLDVIPGKDERTVVVRELHRLLS